MRSKKVKLIIVITILVMSLIGCSKANQSTNPDESTLVLKLANASSIGDERDQSLHKFAELVEEKSAGKVKIEVFSGGTLGGWRETIEGLRPGVVQIVCESLGTLEAYSSTASIDAYPYLYRDVDHYSRVMASEIGEELLDTIGKESGFVLMGPSNRGARIMTTNKRVENADDLKGLKIRAPGIQMYIKTWQYLGASPTPMDTTEIYTGLQQGTVDAQENPVLYSYGNAFYDVCDYLVLSNHVYSTDVFIFDKEYFDSLPEDIQDILRESAVEAGNYRTELVLKTEQETIKKFEEEGLEIIEPNVESFKAKLTNFSQEFPNLTELVEKIQSFE